MTQFQGKSEARELGFDGLLFWQRESIDRRTQPFESTHLKLLYEKEVLYIKLTLHLVKAAPYEVLSSREEPRHHASRI